MLGESDGATVGTNDGGKGANVGTAVDGAFDGARVGVEDGTLDGRRVGSRHLHSCTGLSIPRQIRGVPSALQLEVAWIFLQKAS